MSRLYHFALGLGVAGAVVLFVSPEARGRARQLLLEAAARGLDVTEEYRDRLKMAVEEGRRAAEETERELKDQLAGEKSAEEAPRFIV